MKNLLTLLFALVGLMASVPAYTQNPCSPVPCGCELQVSFTTASNDCGLTTQITITVSGGNAPYTIGWSDGNGNGGTITIFTNTVTITVLPGVWGIWATSQNGCGGFEICIAAGPLTLMLNAWWVCGANGSCVMPSGGTPPYTETWTNQNGIVVGVGTCIYDIPAGLYFVSVVDAMGCLATGSNTVQEITPPQIMMVNVTNSTCNEPNGNIASMASGTDPLQYQWFGPNGFTAVGPNIGGLVGGPNEHYTLLVTDSNGCTASQQVLVGNFGSPQATNLTDTTCDSTQAGVFVQNLQTWQGCDSTVTTTVTLLPSDTTLINATTCDSSLAGTNFQYLTNQFGCDSIVETMVSLLPSSATYFSSTTCDPIEAGVFVQDLINQYGCDSTVTTTVTLLQSTLSTMTYKICDGDFFWFFGFHTTTGFYSHTFASANGCDSIVTLHLTVLPPADTVLIFETTCRPDQAGTFTEVILNNIFCEDTVIIKTVTFVPLTTQFEMIPTCDPAQSGNWSVENLITQDSCPYKKVTILTYQIPQQQTVLATSCIASELGIETDTLKNALGCDSVYVTIVTSSPQQSIPATFLTIDVCDASQVGTTSQTFTTATGCDSLVVTTKNFVPILQTETQAEICAGESYIFGGEGLFAQGIYKDTLQATVGCDSIVTLFLTVLAPPQGSESETICAGESVQWNSESYSYTGNYFHVFTGGGWNGCDSLAMLHLVVLLPNDTIKAYAPTCVLAQNGQISYTTGFDANGCDLVTATTLYWEPEFWQTVALDTCIQVLNGVVMTDTIWLNGCNGILTKIYSYSPNYESLTTWSCDGPTSDTTYTEVSGGCVTQVTLHRQNYPTAVGYESQQLCLSEFPFTWNSMSIPSEGIYTNILTGASWHGCDSTVHLTVFELPVSQAFDTVAVCKNGFYSYQGNLLGQGDYEFPATSQAGCDSMYALTVMEIDYTTAFDTPDDVMLIAPNDSLFNANEWVQVLTAGVQAELDLPLGMTLVNSSLTQISDSTWVQEFIFQTPCETMEMSRTILVRSSEDQIELPEFCRFRIYPNPSSVGQNVTGEFEGFFGELKLTITSSTGSLETESVHQVNGFNQQIQINFPQQKGVWFLRIQDNEHNFVVRAIRH